MNETMQGPLNLDKKENLEPHEKIFSILFDKDEITWQNIIYELVKTNEMDPWDIDIGLLTKKYIQIVRKMKEFDFRVSGKVVLAAALLLKIKSKRLMGEDLEALDQMFAGVEEDQVEGLFDEEVYPEKALFEENRPFLLPRTPQPRKRKVSVYDLVHALEKALEVKRRRVLQNMPELKIEIPKKTRDITLVIKDIYFKIKNFFSKGHKKVTFSHLVPNGSTKYDKIYTFIPLLHLSNQRKIDLEQEIPFGEIEIILKTEKEVDKELGEAKEPAE